LCVQQRLARSVGNKPTQVRARSLVAWMAGRREINDLKPIDNDQLKGGSESPGRNESERRCGLENEEDPEAEPATVG
jgi:hypothetical protein